MSTAAISIARTATANGCKATTPLNAFLAASVVVTTPKSLSNGNSTQYNNNSNNNYIKRTMTKQSATPISNGNGNSNSNSSTVNATSDEQPVAVYAKKPELAAKIIQQTNVVCFDVDSTVICEEGIDELADFCGKGSEVARVTKEAMGGSMSFQDALKIRLNIIRPTQAQIADFIRQRPSTLTRNIKRFVEQLRANGKDVYLISGGFDCLIAPVAVELGIPVSNLYANKLLFDFAGDYVAFDTTQPTSRSGGKAEAIALVRQKYAADALVTMIGDGATDLEAVPPANHFIGFGGNVQRAEVFKRAQYYVSDFEQLMSN